MKTICVPINKEAQSRLDMGYEENGDLIEEIINKDEFYLLFSSGFISEINRVIGTNIDDYEDEHVIEAMKITEIKKIAHSYSNRMSQNIFQRVENIATLALEKKTGIHFYF